MARKWLGVDAGENSGNGGERTGEAIVWLRDSRRTLMESLGSSSGSGSSVGGGGGKVSGLFKKSGSGGGKEEKKERKGKVGDALESVESFLKAYEKANDQVRFSFSTRLSFSSLPSKKMTSSSPSPSTFHPLSRLALALAGLFLPSPTPLLPPPSNPSRSSRPRLETFPSSPAALRAWCTGIRFERRR